MIVSIWAWLQIRNKSRDFAHNYILCLTSSAYHNASVLLHNTNGIYCSKGYLATCTYGKFKPGFNLMEHQLTYHAVLIPCPVLRAYHIPGTPCLPCPVLCAYHAQYSVLTMPSTLCLPYRWKSHKDISYRQKLKIEPGPVIPLRVFTQRAIFV